MMGRLYGDRGPPPPPCPATAKKAGCPPNIGRRAVGAATAGLSAFRSAMLMVIAPGPIDSRFQRSMLLSLGSGTGCPNLLNDPSPRVGNRKLLKSPMLSTLSLPVRQKRASLTHAARKVSRRHQGRGD